MDLTDSSHAPPPSLLLSPRRKPDPAFFRLALERVGVAADEAVFLDDIGHNLAAARKLGMHTIRASLLPRSLVLFVARQLESPLTSRPLSRSCCAGVQHGKSRAAIAELEKLLGMDLMSPGAKL